MYRVPVPSESPHKPNESDPSADVEDRHPILLIRATNDLAGQLAKALDDYTAKPFTYLTPIGGQETVNLRQVVDQIVGAPAELGRIRAALVRDAAVLGKLLAAIAQRLPYTLVLVIDQAEEIFTLPSASGSAANRQYAFRMLQHLLDVRAKLKVIVSLRTEYYGRFIDQLRVGRRDVTGQRDYLLTDLSREDIYRAVVLPTSESVIDYTSEAPHDKYKFSYAPLVAESITDEIVASRSHYPGSVLPLLQAICTQLYEQSVHNHFDVITSKDLQSIGGITGGFALHVESLIGQFFGRAEIDKLQFKQLMKSLCVKHSDGVLTTTLVPVTRLEKRWRGLAPFPVMLRMAIAGRLLREEVTMGERNEATRLIGLGHDALTGVIAAWRTQQPASAGEAEFEQARPRRRQGRVAEVPRVDAQLAKVADMWRRDPLGARTILEDSRIFPESQRDFAWGYFRHRCYRKPRVLDGYGLGGVCCVALSPDGILLASCGRGLVIRLWDLPTGSVIKELEGHEQLVTSVAFSPDGKTLASGSWDNTVRLWDALTGEGQIVNPGHEARITSAEFSPDGTVLAAGSADNTVLLWDLTAGKLRLKLSGHTGPVNCLAFSRDGKSLASGSDDASIRLWDLSTGASQRIPSGHEDSIYALAFSPDSATLASGGWDKSIRLWNLRTSSLQRTVWGNSSVHALSFSTDGKMLAAGRGDHNVMLLDATGTLIVTLPGHENVVLSVKFSLDAHLLVSASLDATISLWDVRPSRLHGMHVTNPATVHTVGFSQDGRMAAMCGEGDSVHVWDTVEGTLSAEFKVHEGSIRSATFSPDGTTLALGDNFGIVRLWDTRTWEMYREQSQHEGDVMSLTFTPDGRILISAGWDKTIKISQVATGRLDDTLYGHSGYLLTTAVSPDSLTLATGGGDRTIRLWDITKRVTRFSLTGHAGPVSCLAFAPDGELLASGSFDYTIKLWDITEGEIIATLVGHAADVTALAFSSDGRSIAAGSNDKSITIWNVATGQLRAILDGHDGTIHRLFFTSNDSSLISGSGDRTIRYWDTYFGY